MLVVLAGAGCRSSHEEGRASEPNFAFDPSFECVRAAPIGDSVAAADELMNGSLRLDEAWPAVDISGGIDWGMDPYDHPSWRFGLHNLKFLHSLEFAYDETGDEAYLQFARSVLLDWATHNPQDEPPSDQSWSDHAIAIRAHVISCMRGRYGARGLRPLAQAHADYMSQEENYAGAWNHGLEQNVALLSLGCTFGEPAWVEAATARIERDLPVMVDDEGVTNEQAIAYQGYVWWLLSQLAEQLDACGQPLPAQVQERQRMDRLLAHAIMPNGMMAPIGDTPLRPPEVLPGPQTRWAAHGGREGQPPSERVLVSQRGYVFGRTDWEHADDSTVWYGIRFGPGREIHGHRDHTSILLYAFGRLLLTEAGFGGYRADEHRAYELRELAHNMVVSPDGGRFRWDSETGLRPIRTEGRWHYYELYDRPYSSIRRNRRILIDLDLPAVVVRDNLASDGESHRYQQLWHVPPELETRVEGTLTHSSDGTVTLTIAQLAGEPQVVVSRGAGPIPGWVATGPAAREPADVIIAELAGQGAEFLTVLVPHRVTDPVDVRFVEERIEVRVGEHASTFRLDEERHLERLGFQ